MQFTQPLHRIPTVNPRALQRVNSHAVRAPRRLTVRAQAGDDLGKQYVECRVDQGRWPVAMHGCSRAIPFRNPPLPPHFGFPSPRRVVPAVYPF
jgi:hypothetical protein